MIMLGSKFFPKGSLKCSQLGRGWLKNKQISYISPNFGGSGFRSQSSGVGFKGPAHILWSGLTCSLQGGATGEHSSCPWNPASNLSTSTHRGLAQRARHVAWLRRQGRETKKQVQPLVDGDTLLFLSSPPMSELLKASWGSAGPVVFCLTTGCIFVGSGLMPWKFWRLLQEERHQTPQSDPCGGSPTLGPAVGTFEGQKQPGLWRGSKSSRRS